MMEYYKYIKAPLPSSHVLQAFDQYHASTWLTLVHAYITFGLLSCRSLFARQALKCYILHRLKRACQSQHI